MGQVHLYRKTKFVTKLFKETPVRISYTTNSSIKKLLSKKPYSPQTPEQYERSGVYQLTCPDCNKKYIGQTGRSFHKRYQEHFHDFKFNKYKSKFATHLLENKHSIGPINEIMEILYTTSKGRLMDTIEKFYIYNETHLNNQINYKDTVKFNAIYDVLIHKTPHRELTNPSSEHQSRQ
jgi:transposase-like protein